MLATLKLFSPALFPNYSQTGFRSRDLKFHLERSLVHTFVCHCEITEPPSLLLLLEWKKLIPDCPYPLFEVGDSLIPFEVKYRFNRRLWDIPHHPIQQVSSLFIRLLDNYLLLSGLERGDTLYPSPFLSLDQVLSLQLSPPIPPYTYKCFKKSLQSCQKLAEYLLSPSLLFHIPHLLSSSNDRSRACITIVIGETYHRCGISHLPSEQHVSNQLMLFATFPESCSCTSSLHSILLQLLTQLLLLSSCKLAPPDCAPGAGQYSEILDNPSNIRHGGSILATTAEIQGACYAGLEGLRAEVALIYLDTLATLLYDIPDTRVLWSRSSRALDIFTNMPPLSMGIPQWTPPNLHPLRLQHDLCFWHPWGRKVPECEVATAIRCYCEEYALSAALFNEFICPLNRLSHNYRLVLQSCDLCLSRSRAHRLQSLARELLRDFYGVELR